MNDKEIRQRIANLVRGYEESLEAVGQPSLTEGQREVLRAFLMIAYEESINRQKNQKSEVSKVD
jgi:hypothetical protein